MAANKLPIERLHEIEQLASQVHAEAVEGLDLLDLTLADDLNLHITVPMLTYGEIHAVPNHQGNGKRWAGSLRWSGNIPVIQYEQYDPLVRQRFSIAHETGHFYLHSNGQNSFYDAPADMDLLESDTLPAALPNWQLEAEANAFAAAFLVPAEQLCADIGRFGPAISFLAERYCVSKEAMSRRVETLMRLGMLDTKGSDVP